MKTNRMLLLNLCSLLSVLWLPTVFSSELLYTYCPANETQNYTVNSTFALNIRILLSSISTYTSISGFYNGSVGSDVNTVYAEALCRGDVSPSDCELCVQNASQAILRQCRTIEAITWFELCQVHYSYYLFFSSVTYAGKYLNDTESNTTDPAKYGSALSGLMGKLSDQAAFNSSRKMFAVGQVQVSDVTMYGLVQCTRGISPGDCRYCLTLAFGDLNGCCSSRQGGTILSYNCNMRFETHLFYNATTVSEIIVTTGGRSISWKLIVTVAVPILVLIVAASIILYYKIRKRTQEDEINQGALMSALTIPRDVVVSEEGNLQSTDGLPFMDLSILKVATDNFSDAKKLGEGGFGGVYEGVLPDGRKIAVKRLARRSWQGLAEFRNEIILIANLQHRNLVKLLGCGVEGHEKLLVYDYMPFKSLDLYIYDAEKRAQLNWGTRFKIISGIAKGLLYLHDGSRLRIIHRDLKPSNTLLDEEMTAKISDFGIARIFCEDQNTATTKRVVGTYGYMAPEYAMEGLFSVKSDVFSYGVIVLEIISGIRSSSYLNMHSYTLVSYAWELWNNGKELEFIDSLLAESYPTEEVLRCLHVALLCVQGDPAERPSTAHVVSLLSGESLTLPQPKSPAISAGLAVDIDRIMTVNSSVNEMTSSTIDPR